MQKKGVSVICGDFLTGKTSLVPSIALALLHAAELEAEAKKLKQL
jgi:hypothetical protein